RTAAPTLRCPARAPCRLRRRFCYRLGEGPGGALLDLRRVGESCEVGLAREDVHASKGSSSAPRARQRSAARGGGSHGWCPRIAILQRSAGGEVALYLAQARLAEPDRCQDTPCRRPDQLAA